MRAALVVLATDLAGRPAHAGGVAIDDARRPRKPGSEARRQRFQGRAARASARQTPRQLIESVPVHRSALPVASGALRETGARLANARVQRIPETIPNLQ